MSPDLSIQQNHGKQPYELSVDDIFEADLGDVYKYRSNLTKFNINETLKLALRGERRKVGAESDTDSDTDYDMSATTSEPREHVATKPLLRKPISDTFLKRIKVRMLTREIQSILQDASPISMVQNTEDPISQTSRRFNELRNKNLTTRKQYRRDNYPMNNYKYDSDLYKGWENATMFIRIKRRLLTIMEHFIYSTRYRLMYSQKLRIKYRGDAKYKLGFLFALLKSIKQKQRILLNSYRKEYFIWQSFFIHLKVYQRIIRFDVDVKDVIKYIKQLEYERKQKEFPDYYDYIPSSTGRYWRRKGQEELVTTTPTY